MKKTFILILFLSVVALSNATTDSCYKITEKSGMDMSDAICILSNDSVILLNSDGWFCMNIHIPIFNKIRIKKPGFYDYILYLLWEDSSEYRISMTPDYKRGIPNLSENKNMVSYNLGNKITPPHGRLAAWESISPGNEIYFYFDSKADTCIPFLCKFSYFITRINDDSCNYRINFYGLNNGTIKLDSKNNIILFEPNPKSVFFSTEKMILNKRGWHSVKINQWVPSHDFVVGIEYIPNSTPLHTKEMKYIGIGICKRPTFAKKINSIFLEVGGSYFSDGRFSYTYDFRKRKYKKPYYAVYCEMKNF